MKKNLIPYLLILFISLSWALSLDLNWSTDFGVYYTGAASFSEGYRLYAEHFDHKGPSYYAFLTVIGKVIGFGPLQALVSIFLTSLFFCITVMQICKKFGYGLVFQNIMLLCCGNLLYYQTHNSSIAIFQGALLLCAFYFLQIQIETGNYKFLILSLLFWALSFQTRIDSIIFAPIYLFSRPLSKKLFKNILILSMLGVSISFLVLIFFSNYFSFEIYNYYKTNFVFNKIHGSLRSAGIEYFWYRPKSFSLFLLSGIPFVLLAYLPLIKKKISFKNFNKVFYPFSITFIAIIIFLISMNDREHHALIFLIPMIFSITLFFKNSLKRKTSYAIILFLIIGYPNTLALKNIYSSYANIRDDKFLMMKNKNDILIINEMVNNKDCVWLGERAWYYLFSKTKPIISVCPLIYNSRYNSHSQFFIEHQSYTVHKNLIKKSGQKIISGNKPTNNFEKEIFKNSKIVKNISSNLQMRIIN